ncbi:uncharacterized protein LOC115318020 isoform X2 [Ixodes scapularis]|uniref:uncharacterized protein LOC115318020 isoform X2 n=1 Tax=Ixodes scapularis TaxID=6945 RepID=UPI001C383913|nr:uncharacterized protein LOC115318020 isoform X2 [Ixodes scapularis]
MWTMKSFMNDAFEHIEAEVPCRGPLQALNHREPRAARTRWLCSRWCRVSWLGTPWPRAPRPSPGTPDPRGPSPSRREKKQRSFSGPLLTRKSDVLRRLQTPVSLFSMQYLERNKSLLLPIHSIPESQNDCGIIQTSEWQLRNTVFMVPQQVFWQQSSQV